MKSKAWICATERLTPHCPPRLPQWRMNSVAAGDRFEWASLISVITEISDERSFESRGYWQGRFVWRSEEQTSELQSLMRNSYAVFCLKKKNKAYKPINIAQQTHNN